jgi:hypothetical protein
VRSAGCSIVLLGLLAGRAWADPPPDGNADPAPPADATPPPAGAPAPADPPPETAPERVRHLADAVDELARLASKIGLDTGSHEAARLSNALNVAASYLELGLQVAAANHPSAMSSYWSAALGGGDLQAPDRRVAGELALTAGVAISGPTCTLLDLGGRISAAIKYGPAIAESGRLCLGAIPLEDEAIPADTRLTVLAINAYESAGVNVRPSVEAAAVTDSRRFALAEAGLSVEGMRWFWTASRRWSVAAPWVSLGQSFLTRSVDGDREYLARVTAAAWFTELRYHRDPGQLTDFAMRLLPIAAETVESGQALNTLSLIPLELIGLGTHGVYVDAAGGLDLTAEQEGDTPEEIASKPDVGIGSWRLALRLGVPRIHGELISRQHLLPTLDDAVVIERRASASLHIDVRRLFLDAEAYRANLRLFRGSGDAVDATFDTWGVRGEAWVRAGRHLLVGATFEFGRSFAFAEPSSAMGTPPLGHLVLAQLGWRSSKTRAIE